MYTTHIKTTEKVQMYFSDVSSAPLPRNSTLQEKLIIIIIIIIIIIKKKKNNNNNNNNNNNKVPMKAVRNSWNY
jgi:hypothetical protein